MMAVARVGLALALAVVPAGVAHGDESKRAAGLADFCEVCPAALLAPSGLPAALEARDFSKSVTGNPGATVGATLHASADGMRTVTLTRYRFSDFSIASCIVSFSEPLSIDELADLRRRLEAQALVGRLEGELIEPMPGLNIGTLKRPGNSPIMTVNITATAKVTTLTMNRWDLLPSK